MRKRRQLIQVRTFFQRNTHYTYYDWLIFADERRIQEKQVSAEPTALYTRFYSLSSKFM